jgi:NAD+ kinase
MNIALYSRKLEPKNNENIRNLVEALQNRGVTLFFHQHFSDLFPSESTVFAEALPPKTELVLSLGGDGTVLETAMLVKNSGIPVLGLNFGKMGFLAAQNDSFEDIAQALVDRNFQLESRSLIELITPNGLFPNFPFALNDLTILKKDRASMIGVHVSVNGQRLSTIWADGIIVATPTGSTGYSLSCGGPIAFPDSPIFIISPIAPHQLNVRPVVVPDHAEIELSFKEKNIQFAATLDSRTEWFDSNITLKVKKADFHFRLVRLPWENFPENIRKKLQWGIDIRN